MYKCLTYKSGNTSYYSFNHAFGQITIFKWVSFIKKIMGAYKSALIAGLPFLLRGAAIEECRNRKGHFSSIAALLLLRPAVEKGAPQ